MGGKLFGLTRLSREEYEHIERKIKEFLSELVGKSNVLIPKYYGDKTTFGDVDVLLLISEETYKSKEQFQVLRNDIVKGLTNSSAENSNSQRVVYKNGTLSFVMDEKIQTDVSFFTNFDKFRGTYNFCCYNDLGNILGKIYHRFNLKYSENGLSYVYRRKSNPNYLKEHLISSDMSEILAFIDLPFAKWRDGFQSLEEMFEYCVNCPYFTYLPFVYHKAAIKKRVKHRTTMKLFVDYLRSHFILPELLDGDNSNDNNNIENNIIAGEVKNDTNVDVSEAVVKRIAPNYEFEKDRSVYISKINSFFPSAKLVEFIKHEDEEDERAVLIGSKFSGKLVRELYPHLKDAEMGKFMKSFKALFNDFEEFVFSTEEAEIRRIIDSHYQPLFSPSSN